MSAPLLSEEEVLVLLDAQHDGWRGDREGWVTLECRAIMWRIHYRRGELLEVGWWGTLEHALGVQHRARSVGEGSRGQLRNVVSGRSRHWQARWAFGAARRPLP